MLKSLLNKNLYAYDIKTHSYPIQIKLYQKEMVEVNESQWEGNGRKTCTNLCKSIQINHILLLWNDHIKYIITKNDDGMIFNKNTSDDGMFFNKNNIDYVLIEDFEVKLVV